MMTCPMEDYEDDLVDWLQLPEVSRSKHVSTGFQVGHLWCLLKTLASLEKLFLLTLSKDEVMSVVMSIKII